jgi:CDP-paratose 2-epimerase
MRKIIVTGSAGLIGSEAVKRFASEGYGMVGIDNDMRSRFSAEASTQRHMIYSSRRSVYEHHDLDIRDAKASIIQGACRHTCGAHCGATFR